MEDYYNMAYSWDDDWDDNYTYEEWSCDEYLGWLNCMSWYADDDATYLELYTQSEDTLYSMESDDAALVCDSALDKLYADREATESEGCYLWY